MSSMTPTDSDPGRTRLAYLAAATCAEDWSLWGPQPTKSAVQAWLSPWMQPGQIDPRAEPDLLDMLNHEPPNGGPASVDGLSTGLENNRTRVRGCVRLSSGAPATS